MAEPLCKIRREWPFCDTVPRMGFRLRSGWRRPETGRGVL